MTDVTAAMSERFTGFLRTEYPRNTAKVVAQELRKVAGDTAPTPRTVQSWLDRQNLPQQRHLAACVMRWGRAFLDAYFDPCFGSPDPEDLDRRAERLRHDIEFLLKEATRK